MHDQSFPTSEESPEQRTARAVEALQYEERAGLGFRRRKLGEKSGDPYGKPADYDVTREMSGGEILASYLGAAAVVLGAGAIFYKPLVLASVAALCGVTGSIGGGQAARVARIGLIVASIGFTLGLLLAMGRDTKVF